MTPKLLYNVAYYISGSEIVIKYIMLVVTKFLYSVLHSGLQIMHCVVSVLQNYYRVHDTFSPN
jgi:hypothetical protein